MQKVLKIVFFITILFLLSGQKYVSAKTITVVCNNDFLTCGSLDSKSIDFGLLPFALQRKGVNDVRYISYSDAYLNNVNFDLAVITLGQATALNKYKKYVSINIPLHNAVVRLNYDNNRNKILPDVGVCLFDALNTDCLPIRDALQQFNAGKANVVLYRSQLQGYKKALSQINYEPEVLQEMSYDLLIKPDSPLMKLDLADAIAKPSSLSVMEWVLVGALFIVLVATCIIVYTTYNAKIDEQSGCLNKKAFESRFRNLVGQDSTIMLIDYNHFKLVNDNFGHQKGDRVIEYMSSEIIKILRKGDCIYRIGGDEFLIEFYNSLPESRVIEIKSRMDRAAMKVASELGISSVNFGLAIGHKQIFKGDDYLQVYRDVDQEMYQYKRMSKLGR